MKKPEFPPQLKKSNYTKILLQILSDENLLQRLLNWEKSYPYWEKFKHLANAEKVSPENLWHYIKKTRHRNPFNIELNDTQLFKFHYNLTNFSQELLHKFDMNLGGTLEGASIIPTENKERYLINSIMEEAIASSQLEGAVTTREVAKEMLRTQRKPRDHSEKMILNNYLTIKEILNYKDEELTPDVILSIHSSITKDTLDDKNNEGSIRKNNNVKVTDINGTIFYDPPSYKQLDQLLTNYCDFANSKNDPVFIHPIIRAIILHFLMGYIHPFVDGNGRTARAIFYWYMLKKGYWLTEYMTISRVIIKSPAQYARAYLYTEYDDNDLTYFINYHLKSMDLAFQGLKDYITRKQELKKQSFKLLKNHNLNQRQSLILKEFLNSPELVISIKEIQGKYQVTYQTARTDLLDLVEKDYLEKTQQGKAFYFFRSNSFEKKLSI